MIHPMAPLILHYIINYSAPNNSGADFLSNY